MSTREDGAPAATTRAPLASFYFLLVGLFAFWVGLWGFFFPDQVDRALPWKVPPLHARVLGAFYISGLALMAMAAFRRHTGATFVALTIAVVWTGTILVASLLHLAAFDPANPRVWFWFFAYLVFPPWGAWMIWRDRAVVPPKATPAAPWMAAYLLVQGLVCCALALCLLLVPATMTGLWPWKIAALLTQIYAGPFLSYGVGSLLLVRRRHAVEITPTAAAMAIFAVLVLAASFMHRGLFPPGSPAALAWFAGLALAGGALCALVVARRPPIGDAR